LANAWRAWRLDDEGGGVGVILIRVRLEPPVSGFFERESEGGEALADAEPGVAAVTLVDLGPAGVKVAAADAAVEAIAGNNEVGTVFRRDKPVVGDLKAGHQPHAQFGAARLQDTQQPHAADAAKAVAAGADGEVLEVDVDAVPVIERLQNSARSARRPRPGCPGSGRKTPRPSRRCRTGRCAR
jgi:hypothetical protein